MTTSPPPKSVGSLLSDGMEQLSRLFRGEIELARSELRESVGNAMSGVIFFAAAAIMAIVALNLFAGAAVGALIDSGLGAGLAALLVGAGFLLLCVVLALVGKSRLSQVNAIPRRTANQLRQDAQMIKETVTNDRP